LLCSAKRRGTRIGAKTRKDRFLHDDLAVGAIKDLSAWIGMFAFGVFAHDEEINIARLSFRQRTRRPVK